ncbi:uncharacterized protein N7498_003343 [Penicillium cinerascens]|uniref:Uncharacterized protein n=1 Tax=Penicillium cinerascens TaxID=70096 RepID=A0A9W9T6T7_9EURO|nr:uncharacterized protein N7498_003343 [Penicillium cinerascens]KAJ5211697.1 hypothetical protein N7498_003343 [Penicillium cinerascens]
MTFFARLHALILLTVISMVAASLVHIDHLPGIAARIIDRGFVTATATRVVTEINCGSHAPPSVTAGVLPLGEPTDLIVSGMPTVVATEPTTTHSVSATEVTQVTISLPSTKATWTSVIEVTSATLSTPVRVPVTETETETEPCPSVKEMTSVSFSPTGTKATSVTLTETEPVPFSSSVKTPEHTTSDISTQTFKVIPKPLTTVTPGVNAGTTTAPVDLSTLSAGIKPTGMVVTISCSNCAKSPGTAGTTAAPPAGITNTTYPVSPTTSVLVHTGVADHQSGFLTHSIMVAVSIVVFLNAL